MNYKNGRFCQEHRDQEAKCGIFHCDEARDGTSPSCSIPSHKAFYNAWHLRFKRVSFHGLRRIIHRPVDAENGPPAFPSVEDSLPMVDGVQGSSVIHTFQARKVFCIETIQWACGIPIAWGKCYDSESTSQVHNFIDRVWGVTLLHWMAHNQICYCLRTVTIKSPSQEHSTQRLQNNSILG
jgi:hypothetical protein